MIDKDDYYLHIARTVSIRGNCIGRIVGAVIVRNDRIVATGYNGTVAGLKNCQEGGCIRCSRRAEFPTGTAYDLCICVHAEANAIAMAAKYGIALDDTTLYCTDQPCFGCAKESLQVGISRVVYIKPWKPDERVVEDYLILQGALNAVQRTPEELPPVPQPN